VTKPELVSSGASPGWGLTQGLTQAHAAQGGVTLGPEQGELGANFCHLGILCLIDRPAFLFE
jgi:hypothetical protein